MCGDDPKPDINKDDVSKDKGNNLSDGLRPTDGQEAVDKRPGGKEPRLLEAFETRTFEDVWPDVKGIKKDAAPTSVDDAWKKIGDQLHTSALAFEREVNRLKDAGGWEGKTIKAAYDNAVESISEPFYTGSAALRGAELVHKFRATMNYVHENLVKDPLGEKANMWDRYQYDLNWQKETHHGKDMSYTTTEETTAGEKEAIKQYYNEYMRLVMNDSYKPGIKDVYTGYPQFVQSTEPAKKIDIPGLPEGPGKPGDNPGGDQPPGPGSGTPPGPGGGLPPGPGGGSPTLPKTPGASLPDGLPNPNQPNLPSPGDSNPTNPGQPTNPAPGMGGSQVPSSLADAAKQATQAATQAAKPPTGGPPPGLGKKPKLPEGALQLGKGGPSSGTGGTGGGRGGGSDGAGLAGAPKGLPSGLPGQPAAATQAAAAGTPRIGAGAGAPPMGAPGTPGGAGHGAGGAQQGKEHKVNKALRSRQNGTEIAGEAEAVIPVIGQEQGEDQGQDQHEEVATRRGPDRSQRPPTRFPAPPTPATGSEPRQPGA